MVQVDISQLSLLKVNFFPIGFNQLFEEFPQIVRVVNKDLQQLLDLDWLLARCVSFRCLVFKSAHSKSNNIKTNTLNEVD